MSEPNIEGNAGGTAPSRREPNHIRRAVILWVVLSIIGIIVVILITPFVLPPTSSASDLSNADNLTMVALTILSVPVGMFVFVFLGYSLFAFKVKERPSEAGIPLQPSPTLQISWLGITSLLCLFLLIWGLFAFYQQTAAASTNTLIVRVTAQQWLWTFDYPQYGLSVQGQEIDLPVNRPVQFVVTSEDVLHGFSIHALAVRVDANPGEITTTSIITPVQTGNYTVNCVELCGLYHSYMWEAVNVVSESTFESWITSQGGHL